MSGLRPREREKASVSARTNQAQNAGKTGLTLALPDLEDELLNLTPLFENISGHNLTERTREKTRVRRGKRAGRRELEGRTCQWSNTIWGKACPAVA